MVDRSMSVPASMFEEKYRQREDPWDFAASDYEQEKYRATLAALPREHYRNALEIGCSIGVFTRMLAGRCDRLLAIDVSEQAVQRAARRTEALSHVQVVRMQIPADFPNERFDLIVLSEVGYYWSMADLVLTREQILSSLVPGGQIILVHWTQPIDDAPLTGDEVHAAFLDIPEQLKPIVRRREATYRLDVLEKHHAG